MKMESTTLSRNLCPLELQNAIAVVGMSCRFPESNNVEEFWELLVNGKDGIREPPNWRWVGDEHLAHDPDVRKQKGGFLKCPVDEFDAKFFGISPREAEMMDPQQRLLLEVTWESLENAGINPLTLRGTRTGVFSGVWGSEYENLQLKYTPKHILKYVENFMENSYSAVPGRISYQLGLTGPNIATESGCASSMISVHLACQSLLTEETDLAIVGGVNLILHPFTVQSIKAGHVLSPDGKCKAFDASSDGFVRAEGCASLVLKRYPDALKDGDRILAGIRGSAMSQEGISTNFRTPTKEGQAACIKAALKKAGISPYMVSYVEAHGTGTVTGDPVEIAGISEVYSIDRKEPLSIGSVKTNIGHTEACAGLAGLIKVILSLEHKTIPPHINFKIINPKINLAAIPACLPKEAVEWKINGDAPRIAGVSSFGMSGANVHVIIQETPTVNNGVLQDISNGAKQDMHQIVTISGKSEQSLKDLTIRYSQFLESHSQDIENFCYTANVCRAVWNHRIVVIGKNAQEMINNLDNGTWVKKKEISLNAKVVFLFTGQGSQFVGMGKTLYKNNTLFRQHFDECSKILENRINIFLPNILWSDQNVTENDDSDLDQICIFCIEYCLWKLWENLGVTPDFILGHSTGESAAAVAAGILSLEDILHLLVERSKLTSDMPNGQMLAIKANLDTVNDLLRKFLDTNNSEWLDIAAINSDSQTVVAGSNDTIKKFKQFCGDNFIKSTLVSAKRAYHSRDVDLILPPYDKILSKLTYNSSPKFKYISSTTGNMVTDGEIDKDYWKRNTRMAVNFKKAFDLVLEQDGRIFVEIGPQPVLLNIGNAIASEDISKECLWVPSMKKSGDEWKTFLEGVGHLFVNGFDIDWKSFHGNFPYKKITIPTYPFEHTRKYWMDRQTTFSPMNNFNGLSFHPLIGNKIFLPNSKKAFHQQDFKLEALGYFRDHVIANKVIVPGACFLEMIISAGHSILHNSIEDVSRLIMPIEIKEFDIKAALELQMDSNCSMYIDADTFGGCDCSNPQLKVSRKIVDDYGEVSWITHATGIFSYSQETNDFVLELEKMKLSCTCRDSAEMYSSLDKVGLNFGKSFRSIRNIWENDKKILAEIHVDENSEGYNLHPIIMDGMLQSLILSQKFRGGLQHLAMPTGIKKFVIFPAKSEHRKIFYSHISKANDSIVTLYDEFGNRVAIAEGINLVETSVSQFLKVLSSQELSIPILHEVVWREVAKTGSDGLVYSQSDTTKNSTWLLFSNGNLSNILEQKLESKGKSVTTVSRGKTYSKQNNEYTIDSNEIAQLEQIFETLNTSKVEGVVYMWGLGIENKSVDQITFCRPFLTIIQKLINSTISKQLILVTKGIVSVSGENIINPAVSTLLGLLKSAKAEQPGLDFKSIDLDPANEDLSLDADEIISLMNNIKGETQYASRKQTLFTPRLSKVNLPRKIQIPMSRSEFNNEGTYLITGGLGGIGFEVAKWMLNLGAKSIVLVGRKLPDERISKNIQGYNSQGANVITFQADIGIFEECQNLFHKIKSNFPSLRGIMHAAGVSADATIENQSWENFEKTFGPKVNGTWNLHELSLGHNLEHFVLFSSIASTVGSIGQSNYIAANAFLDSFVYFRKGLGLPAQCINWGPWSEVGMAVNSSHFADSLYGMIPFSTKRGLSALKAIMQSNYSQLTVSDLQPSITLRTFPHLEQYLSELLIVNSKARDSLGNNKLKKGKSILDEIKNKSSEDQLRVIRSAVMSIVCNMLTLEESDSANYTESFVDLGLDSLMAVELRNELQELLGDKIQISSSYLLDYPSAESLSQYILNIIM